MPVLAAKSACSFNHFPTPAGPPGRIGAVAFATALALAGSGAWAQDAARALTLKEVVISAGGFEQELVNAPASVTVVTRAELQRRQISSLADALRGIEGVNVNALDARDGKTGNQSISLRGLPREYTLILIDGVRQNPMGNVTPNSFNDTQSVFIPPVAAIERIEVIRGPMSTLYGSDALGGVVNIITRKPGKSWSGSASIGHTLQSGSEFGDKSVLEAHLAGPLAGDVASLQLYGRLYDRRRSDIDIPGVARPRAQNADTPTMGQNPVGAQAYTVGGKLRVAPSRLHEFSLGFNAARQNYDNTFGDVGALHRTGAPAASACNSKPFPNFCRGYEQELTFIRNQATLGYSGRFDFGRLEAQYTRDALRTEGRTLPLGSGLAPAVEGSPRQLELDTDIVDLKLLTSFGSSHTTTFGAQFIDATMIDGLWGGGSNSLRQYSVFGEDEWQLGERFALTSGLRYDKTDAFSGQFTPRLYGVWKASSDWTFKGGVGKGFRTPYLEQLTSGIIGFGNQGTTPIFGNPDLRPETSTNLEFSGLYARGPWSAQATVFRNELKNLVEAGTGANTGKSLNLGEATIQGLELALGYQASTAVTLSGNYAYTDSEVTSTQLDTGNPARAIARRKGDPLASVPEHVLNAQVNWRATPRLDTFLSMEHRGKAFRPRDFHEPQTGGSSQGAVASGVRDSNAVLGDFKGYTAFNLGMTYRINQHVTLNGVIYNLLNKDFKDYRAYNRCANGGCTTFATGLSNSYNNIQEPRRLFVSLNAQF